MKRAAEEKEGIEWSVERLPATTRSLRTLRVEPWREMADYYRPWEPGRPNFRAFGC